MTANAAGAFLQDLVEVGARGAESRDHAEEQTGENAEGGKVAADGVVHGELDPVGAADAGGGEIEPADAEYGEAKTGEAAKDAEEDAFDEELADDAPAGSAEGGADGHLALAGDGAAEHHVGDVGAGDEEHEADGGEHEDENHFDVAAVVALVEGHDERGRVLVCGGVLRGEAMSDAAKFSLGGGEFGAGLEEAEDLELAVVALQVVGGGGEWHPHVDGGGKHETFGHDADDGGGRFVDADLAADDGGRAGVALLPNGVA